MSCLGGAIVCSSIYLPWLSADMPFDTRSASTPGPVGVRLVGLTLGVSAIGSAVGVIRRRGPERRPFIVGLLLSGTTSIAFSVWYLRSGRAAALLTLLPHQFRLKACPLVQLPDFAVTDCVNLRYLGPLAILLGGIIVLVSGVITAIRVRTRGG